MLVNDQTIQVKANVSPERVSIKLPASKSISNRALIINALASEKGNLKNLSEARDTQTMIRLLSDKSDVWDVMDAGTTMRFLTAYAAINGLHKTITGTARMKERPIGILVDALLELGCNIEYLEKEGYPPLSIGDFSGQQTSGIQVRGDISSQYISALMMIAPCLPNGLNIKLKGKIGSRPYINMTRAVMKQFGVEVIWQDDQQISIPHSAYRGITYPVEPDWSSASYWYSIVAIDGRFTVLLKGLTDNSIQGDRIIADMMQSLGVRTEFTTEGALLMAKESVQYAEFDFTDCPDLAQTIAVICAAKGISCRMKGLESLRIKETDRISALQNELRKIGSDLVESNGSRWILKPGNLVPPKATFETYHDHRMAMAFAPLAWLFPVTIQDPSVVSKSYPDFWDDLTEAGAEIAPIIE